MDTLHAMGRAVLDELLRLGVGPVRAAVRRRPGLPLPVEAGLWPDPVDVTDERKAVIAFQRRFRPDLIDGIIDGECRAKLLALLLPRPQ